MTLSDNRHVMTCVMYHYIFALIGLFAAADGNVTGTSCLLLPPFYVQVLICFYFITLNDIQANKEAARNIIGVKYFSLYAFASPVD